MTNIVNFPSPSKRVEPPFAAADGRYWIQDIQQAATFAAYLDNDQEAVEMLVAQELAFLKAGACIGHLPERVRIRCAKYLTQSETELEDMTQRLHEVLYSL